MIIKLAEEEYVHTLKLTFQSSLFKCIYTVLFFIENNQSLSFSLTDKAS